VQSQVPWSDLAVLRDSTEKEYQPSSESSKSRCGPAAYCHAAMVAEQVNDLRADGDAETEAATAMPVPDSGDESNGLEMRVAELERMVSSMKDEMKRQQEESLRSEGEIRAEVIEVHEVERELKDHIDWMEWEIWKWKEESEYHKRKSEDKNIGDLRGYDAKTCPKPEKLDYHGADFHAWHELLKANLMAHDNMWESI